MAATVLFLCCSLRAQEDAAIPLKVCDRLLVAEISIEHKTYRLLVDTGSTSFLDLRSFSSTDSKGIEITSWTGSTFANAREVRIRELRFGERSLSGVTLPAVDLSAIGKACGGRIDGIFGIDLMEKLAVTIDVKRRIAKLGDATAAKVDFAEIAAAASSCETAFNQADAAKFARCLDPDIVWFTPWGELRGRDQVIAYLKENFLQRKPAAAVHLELHRAQPLGQAVLIEYDYTMVLPSHRYRARGTGIVRNFERTWVLVSMHNSVTTPVPAP